MINLCCTRIKLLSRRIRGLPSLVHVHEGEEDFCLLRMIQGSKFVWLHSKEKTRELAQAKRSRELSRQAPHQA